MRQEGHFTKQISFPVARFLCRYRTFVGRYAVMMQTKKERRRGEQKERKNDTTPPARLHLTRPATEARAHGPGYEGLDLEPCQTQPMIPVA